MKVRINHFCSKTWHGSGLEWLVHRPTDPGPSKRLNTLDKSSTKRASPATFGFGSLVKDEVQLRKKEAIGLALTDNQRLGGSGVGRIMQADEMKRETESDNKLETWACLVCTL